MQTGEPLEGEVIPPKKSSSRKGKAVAIVPPTEQPSEQDPIEIWVAWVAEPWKSAVENIVKTGQRLAIFRNKFKHGEWEKALKEHLHMTRSMVRKLIAIGENKVLSNVSNQTHLPPSWTSLYTLTLLTPATVKEKLKSGELNASTEGKEILKWRKVEEEGGEDEDEEEDEPEKKDLWIVLDKAIDRFSKEVQKRARNEGLGKMDYEAAVSTHSEIVKKLNGLLINLKAIMERK